MSETQHRDATGNTPGDDFYTGYLPQAPEGIARHVRRAVILGLAVVAGVAVLAATSQRPFATAFFEFGTPRSFEGIVEVEPVPMLRVQRPGSTVPSRYFLVAFGKRGADAQVRGLHGKRVKLEGTLIHRDDQTMIELVDGTVEEQASGGASPTASRRQNLGQLTLRGEIVDSKCHYGVMKPGERKPHRACATLCIRGGIPPLFVLTNPEGLPMRHLLIVGSDGRALNQEVLPWVAEPLDVTGEVKRLDDLWILETEPEHFERLF